MICLDTNVLIEILKGDRRTLERVYSLEKTLAISVISAMELYYGARNKAELIKLEKFVTHFHLLHVDEEVSLLAMRLVKTYAKSHNLDIPDSLIAATALKHRIPLMTYNLKDFRCLPDLMLL